MYEVLDFECMNRALGGGHGWEHVNSLTGKWLGYGNFKNPVVQQTGTKAHAIKLKTDQAYADRHAKAMSASLKEAYASGAILPSFAGKTHDTSACKKMSEAAKLRALNSSTGRPWIFNVKLQQNKKVAASELDSYLTEGWQKGRKMFTSAV